MGMGYTHRSIFVSMTCIVVSFKIMLSLTPFLQVCVHFNDT
jgi:hypothetical protein